MPTFSSNLPPITVQSTIIGHRDPTTQTVQTINLPYFSHPCTIEAIQYYQSDVMTEWVEDWMTERAGGKPKRRGQAKRREGLRADKGAKRGVNDHKGVNTKGVSSFMQTLSGQEKVIKGPFVPASQQANNQGVMPIEEEKIHQTTMHCISYGFPLSIPQLVRVVKQHNQRQLLRHNQLNASYKDQSKRQNSPFKGQSFANPKGNRISQGGAQLEAIVNRQTLFQIQVHSYVYNVIGVKKITPWATLEKEYWRDIPSDMNYIHLVKFQEIIKATHQAKCPFGDAESVSKNIIDGLLPHLLLEQSDNLSQSDPNQSKILTDRSDQLAKSSVTDNQGQSSGCQAISAEIIKTAMMTPLSPSNAIPIHRLYLLPLDISSSFPDRSQIGHLNNKLLHTISDYVSLDMDCNNTNLKIQNQELIDEFRDSLYYQDSRDIKFIINALGQSECSLDQLNSNHAERISLASKAIQPKHQKNQPKNEKNQPKHQRNPTTTSSVHTSSAVNSNKRISTSGSSQYPKVQLVQKSCFSNANFTNTQAKLSGPTISEVDRFLERIAEIRIPQPWLEQPIYRNLKREIYRLKAEESSIEMLIKNDRIVLMENINEINRLIGLDEMEYSEISADTLKNLKKYKIKQKTQQIKQLEAVNDSLTIRLETLQEKKVQYLAHKNELAVTNRSELSEIREKISHQQKQMSINQTQINNFLHQNGSKGVPSAPSTFVPRSQPSKIASSRSKVGAGVASEQVSINEGFQRNPVEIDPAAQPVPKKEGKRHSMVSMKYHKVLDGIKAINHQKVLAKTFNRLDFEMAKETEKMKEKYRQATQIIKAIIIDIQIEDD